MFDLPTNTAKQRRAATKFRNFLLKDGYHMVQYSVYSRVCAGNDDMEKHYERIEKNLPCEGSVRMISLTEKQYLSQKILLGKPEKEDKMSANTVEIY